MIAEEVLDFLAEHVNENSVTVETGAGYSTIVFAQLGSQHTAITPAADEVREYTERTDVPPTEGFGSLADKLRGALAPRPK